MPIAIVTDSTADVPPEIETRLPIYTIPNILVLEGQSLVDGRDISRTEFYQRLPLLKSPPTTAAPASGTFQAQYERILCSGFTQIISIHTVSALSGIINAASVAARMIGNNVTVVDSGQLSLGVGFQVLEAAEAAVQGLNVEAIVQHLAAVRQRLHVVAMLNTLEYVRRSGRVSWARARLGSLLEIKPFIRLQDGKVLSLGEARTRRKGLERLFNMLHSLGQLDRLAILHANAEEDALQFLDRLKLRITHPPLVVNVTTIIGTHVGPQALGFAALVQTA